MACGLDAVDLGRAQRPGEPDGAHRQQHITAFGTGNAGDCDTQVCLTVPQCPLRHGPGRWLAYCAVLIERCGGHPQHLLLGGQPVSDEGAFEPVGGSGLFGQAGGKQTTGAGFSTDETQSALAQSCRDGAYQLRVDAERV